MRSVCEEAIPEPKVQGTFIWFEFNGSADVKAGADVSKGDLRVCMWGKDCQETRGGRVNRPWNWWCRQWRDLTALQGDRLV